MELYLLKSGVCLAILFLFYKLFLEKENMHRFKRFFLLGILAISFLIPLITFTTYIEIEPSEVISQVISTSYSTEIIEKPFSILDYLPTLLWTIYGIGVVFFSFRFGRNLLEIVVKINRNEKIKISNIINVLLQETIIPHTFFNYIFLNKQKYEADEIPSEVIIHEQTHAKQKHSFDVLIIELFQIVFWFNPFVYYIKHSIKLNHEFLADRAVLSQGINVSNYQNILLAFSSNAYTPQMANAINYSSSRLIDNSFKQVKKRFTVMKTHTSTKKFWFRSILLLPLLAVLIFSFSSKNIVSTEKNNALIEDFYLKIDSEENIYYKDEIISFDEIPNAINSYKETYPNEELYFAKIDAENKETIENLSPFIEIIKENGIEKITACWVKIKSEDIIIKIKKDNTFTVNGIKSSKEKLPNTLTKFNQNLTKELRSNFVDVIIKSEGSVSMGFITDIQEILIDYGINKIRVPGSLHSDTPYQGATKAQLAEYNKLAKKYNNQNKEKRIVLKKDIERLEYIYNLMTDEQKANAEPFPNIPPPPPAPDSPTAPKAPKVIKSENDTKTTIPPPPPKAPKPVKVIKGENDTEANTPPPPKEPKPVKDPLKQIVKLAEEGAHFILFEEGPHFKDGREINSKKAIELLRMYENLTVKIRNDYDLYTIVEIRAPGC